MKEIGLRMSGIRFYWQFFPMKLKIIIVVAHNECYNDRSVTKVTRILRKPCRSE